MPGLRTPYAGTQVTKTYASDVDGMMKDAREYAKRDMTTILNTMDKLGLKVVDSETPSDGELAIKTVVDAVVAVKYEFIDKARNHRPVYEKYM